MKRMIYVLALTVVWIPMSAASSQNGINDAVKKLAEGYATRSRISVADLERNCRVVPKDPRERMTDAQLFCVVYIGAVMDTLIGLGQNGMLVGENETHWRMCIPYGVTPPQNARIFMKYVQEHPEVLHDEAPAVITLAVALAFPCTK